MKEEPNGSRNRIQTPVLLDAVEKHGFTALFGGARRDEDKARAKERMFSFRDEFGQWDPKNQRPELWDLYNGRIHLGESIRVFPLSNWTELDIWQYIAREKIAIPVAVLAQEREVVERQGMLYAVNEFITPRDGEEIRRETGALPHRRRREPDRRRAVARHHRRGGHRRDRGDPDDRARRHPWRRQGQRRRHGRPEEGGLLLMAPVERRRSTSAIAAAAAAAAELAAARKDILRIATAGSVDDGKSTLIGRLLYDSKAIFEDQYEAVERASAGGDYVNLALLTDGLRAEREQGITIDVAYRYFATPRRTFIMADTPGHVQYTRNMVTGASTADLAIVLVDARKGMLEQSRRHAFLASLLRVPHLVVAVNKMDLVDWSEEIYESIRDEFTAFAAKLNVPDLTVIPISALHGDNVVTRSANSPWYDGSSLLHHLEHVHVASDRNLVDTRFPVQFVIRPQSDAFHDYRGYAGSVASGVLRPGDEVQVLPSGLTTTIASIDGPRGPVDEAFAPMSVTIRLTDDLDVSRGDTICRPANAPQVDAGPRRDDLLDDRRAAAPAPADRHQAHDPHGARVVKELQYRLDVNTLHRDLAARELGLNDIGRVRLRTTQPLFVDDYARNRVTGRFILIDEATNATVGAGMLHARRRANAGRPAGARTRGGSAGPAAPGCRPPAGRGSARLSAWRPTTASSRARPAPTQ